MYELVSLFLQLFGLLLQLQQSGFSFFLLGVFNLSLGFTLLHETQTTDQCFA